MRHLERALRILILFSLASLYSGEELAYSKSPLIAPVMDGEPQIYLSGQQDITLQPGSTEEPGGIVDPNDRQRMIIVFDDPQEMHLGDESRSIDNLQEYNVQLISNAIGELQVESELSGVFEGLVALLTPAEINQLRSVPGVKDIVFDQRLQVALDHSLPLIHVPETWTLLTPEGKFVTGQGIKVAVVDTGIDYNHPALGGCFGPGCKVTGGWDFVNNDPDPQDDHGHGTHVSGIIASSDATYRGVAPDASLLAYKACAKDGSCYASHVISAINQAVKDGAQVINLSLSGEGKPDSPLSLAVNSAVDRGLTVVAPAGNTGSSTGYSIGTPGNAEKAITAGATDRAGQVAYFSARGGVWEGFYKPDLVAPGVGIRSAHPGGGFIAKDGTSMSAPHIAGAAALLLQLYPGSSPPEIKARLMQTAQRTRTDSYDAFVEGSGLVHLQRAASAQVLIQPNYLSGSLASTQNSSQAITRTITVRNSAAGSRTYTLTHFSPPGIDMKFTPATLKLEEGASSEVRVDISVENARLPAGDNFSGYIHLQNSTVPLDEYHIAYALTRYLWAAFEFDETPMVVIVKKPAPDAYNASYFPASKSLTIDLLKPGLYDFIVIYPSQVHFVLRTGVQLYSSQSFNIRKSEAANRLRLSYRRGEDRQHLDTEPVLMLSDALVYEGEPVYASSRGILPANGEYYFSDFPEGGYQFNLSVLARLGPEDEYYDFSYSVPGIASNLDLVSDLENSNQVIVPFFPRAEGKPYFPVYSMTLNASHRLTFRQTIPEITEGTSIKLHLHPDTGDTTAFSLRRISLCSTSTCYDQEFGSTRFVETPYLSSKRDGVEILSIMSQGKNYPHDFVKEREMPDETHPVNYYPSFWNGRFANQSFRINLNYAVSGFDWETPYLRDWAGNMLIAPIEYRVFSETGLWTGGDLLEEVALGDSKLTGLGINLPNSGAVRVEMGYLDSYHATSTHNKVLAEFDTTQADPNPPTLQALLFCKYEETPSVYLYIEDESWLPKVEFAISSEENPGWRGFAAQMTNQNIYRVDLNGLEPEEGVRVRLMAEDASGNRITQETSLPVGNVNVCPSMLLGQALEAFHLYLPVSYNHFSP